VGRLYTRGKYLGIKKDAYELPCNISTFLPEELRNAELIKEKDRGEREFRAFNKITSPIPFTGKDSNLIILSNSSSRIF
jgi:hypothetical protein